jgi:uncharacterized protein
MVAKKTLFEPLFPAGPPVEGKGFIGREETVCDLLRLLEMGQSCILMAPRRYGKTSVILETLNRLKKEGHFTVHLDLFSVSSKRIFADRWAALPLANNPAWLEKSWEKIKRGGLTLLRGLKFKPSVADQELVLQLDLPQTNIDTLLEKVLDFPERFAKRHKKILFFAIDEFQSILDFGDSALVKLLRAHIQRHHHVRYLFSGSQEGLMKDLFQDKRHAFYRFGRLVALGPISQDAFIPYIVDQFLKQKIDIEESVARNICDETEGQPYYTQLLCQMLYEIVAKRKKQAVTKEDIPWGLNQLLSHEEGLFSDWWDRLSKKKHAQSILTYVVIGRSPYEIPDASRANLNRVVTELIKLGYLQRKEKQGRHVLFALRDPFFAMWLKKK